MAPPAVSAEIVLIACVIRASVTLCYGATPRFQAHVHLFLLLVCLRLSWVGAALTFDVCRMVLAYWSFLFVVCVRRLLLVFLFAFFSLYTFYKLSAILIISGLTKGDNSAYRKSEINYLFKYFNFPITLCVPWARP